MKRIYLDHSATTPVRTEVAAAVAEYMTSQFGNPSSIHSFGREAKEAVEKARKQVACLIKAKPEEIIFTSCGTEGNNMAITGTARACAPKGKHIITSAVEHHAVLDTCKALEKHGFTVTVLPVDEYGLVKIDDLSNAITGETILITIMHVNNEVGTIEPIEEIGMLAREKGILFHTDAVQSIGKIPLDVEKIDLLTGSAHKIYGPKGTGFLYVRKGIKLEPLFFGGGQEKKRRSGTENIPGIVGLGLACELAGQELEREMARQTKLRDKLLKGLIERIPYTRLNGSWQKRIASNVNISFEYVEGESVLLSLDLQGIAASSGSACTSGSLEPSHVLMAMGICHQTAHGSVRMTLGRNTSDEEIEYVLKTLPPIVERIRMMSPLYDKHTEVYGQCTLIK